MAFLAVLKEIMILRIVSFPLIFKCIFLMNISLIRDENGWTLLRTAAWAGKEHCVKVAI